MDQSQNTNSGAPEALYVDTLIVPTGSTLDLNGLHVYARLVSNKGTILDGTVQQPPPGGALALNTIAAATISSAIPTNDWTFFARANQAVTIVVHTGS